MFNEKNYTKKELTKTFREGTQFDLLTKRKIDEFIGTEVVVAGYLFVKSKFDNNLRLCIITDDGQTFYTKHKVEMFKKFTDEEVTSVLAGKLKLTNFRYEKSKNGFEYVAFDIADN